MFNLDKFISDSVTFRPVSMFVAGIEAIMEQLRQEIERKIVRVIGGTGLICFSIIKTVLRFGPRSVAVVDFNENDLSVVCAEVCSR